MRVIYFHQHFSTPDGSTGIRSYEMAQRLIRDGHDVTMVCGSYHVGKTGLVGDFRRGKRVGKVNGINVIEFRLAYSNSDGFFKRTVVFIKFSIRSVILALTLPYDVIFATSTPLTAGIPGIFARWFRGKPFVFEVRDLWPELPKAMGVIKNSAILRAMSWLEWLTYRSANRIIGLSPGICEGVNRRISKKTMVTMIPNGCDLGIAERCAKPWRPLEVPEDCLLAVFAGTHGFANNLDCVLNAALELKNRQRNDIYVVLVGDGKQKPYLIERARALGLENVLFLNPIDKYSLFGLLAGADVGLQVLADVPAFYYGTSPNKFFDYIAAGLPVLNNYPGWLAGIITEEKCGVVVPANDPLAFAVALIRLADDREKLKCMSYRARLVAKRDFDRAKLAKDFSVWLSGARKND